MSNEPQQQQEQQFGLLDAVNVILQRKKFIIINVVVVTAIAVVVAFTLPKKYISGGTILPPQTSDPFAMLATSGSSLLSRFGSIRSLGVMNEEMYKYVAILQSRTLLQSVVEEFDLKNLYEAEYMNDAMEMLYENIDYTANEEGTLSISVEDRDPERARQLAAYIISTLDSVNIELSSKEARLNRLYIESRINKNLAAMDSAAYALQQFQEVHGVIPVTSEVSESASAMAELYSQRMLKEFEVSYLSEVLGEENPQLSSAEMQLEAIDKKMNLLPELSMESMKLLRDFLVQQKIYEFMAPLYEHAKITEHKNTPTLVVLDAPTVPVRAAFPKKKLIVIVFFAFSLFMSIIIVLFTDRIKRMSEKDSEWHDILQKIRSNLSFRSSKTDNE